MRPRATALLASAALVALAPAAAAAEPTVRELRYDLDVNIPLAAAATVTWVVTEIGKPSLAPERCRWCDGSLNGLDASARRALVWTGRPDRAAMLSDVALFGVAPVSAVGLTALAAWHDGRPRNAGVDTLIIAESTALAAVFNQTVKYVVGRQRPYARFENGAVLCAGPSCKRPDPHDDNLSFFSGHTTTTFAMAVASGTVASMRGYRWAPWVWTQGIAIAAVTGYLRVAADKHYLTDVITGAVVGAAAGFAFPFLLHRPGAPSARPVGVAAAPLGGGGVFSIGGVW
jgi:membrane-associated phospholipid phosphatase